MKLFKRLRLKLGYFTRKELFNFSNEMVCKYNKSAEDYVYHADVENFIHDLKTKK